MRSNSGSFPLAIRNRFIAMYMVKVSSFWNRIGKQILIVNSGKTITMRRTLNNRHRREPYFLNSTGENLMSNLRTALASAAAGAAMLAAAAMPASAAEMKPVLTMSAALAMVEACVALAAQEGWAMHIAVLDSGANLKAYARMDNSMLLSHDIAMAKARTSASFPNSTRGAAQFAFGPDGNQPGAFAFVPGLNFFPGGLPIMSDETHVGGIGVSGASGDQDEQCAQAGLDAAAAAGLL